MNQMKNLHLRIRSARKAAGLTQGDISEACGVSRNAVTQWESMNEDSRTSPATDNLITLSKITGVSLSSLIDGNVTSDVREVSALYKVNKEVVKVKHVSAKAGMGSLVPVDLEHDSQITTVELTKQYIRSHLGSVSNPSNLYIVNAVGDSMQPKFYEGDTVFVDTGISEFVSEAVYFVSYNGDNYIKSVSRDGQGSYILISNNDTYPPINVDVKNEFRIIGKVAGLMSFKKI